MKKQGIIKWFDKQKGYGFIKYENEEYFIHISSIEDNINPVQGQGVRFNLFVNRGRNQARDVELIEANGNC